MPCNRRMNRCGGLRFHPYGIPPAHPLFAMMAMINEAEDEEQHAVASSLSKDNYRWNETEDSYVLSMEIPGVKVHHVTIEEKDGEMEVTAVRMKGQEVVQTYQEVFYVKPKKTDLSNVLATLDDGVLIIVVPKKNPQPVQVPVEQGAVPEPADSEYRFTLDLPGVKVADLKVQLREDNVHVEASRKRGGRSVRMHRVVRVDTNKTNFEEGKGFLEDGVFTLVAPTFNHEVMEAETKPGAVRIIPVQSEDIPSMEGLNLEEQTRKDEKQGEILVETVMEGDLEWEEVNQKKTEKESNMTE